jgi:hypothetical protein
MAGVTAPVVSLVVVDDGGAGNASCLADARYGDGLARTELSLVMARCYLYTRASAIASSSVAEFSNSTSVWSGL